VDRLGVVALLLLAGCAAVPSGPTPQERQALAPNGSLRVCLYLGGPTNALKDPATGEIKGVGFELGQALARRMNVPYEPIIHPTPRAVVEAVTSGGCDATFIAQDPDREKIMDFTAVYMSIEHGFLVPAGSAITTMSQVDRPGIRVGVPARTTQGELPPRARQFYEQAGFHEVGSAQHHHQMAWAAALTDDRLAARD